MTYDRTTGMMHNLPMGAEVFTSDGDKIGEVAEIRGSAFKVDVAMQPDYWLPLNAVSSSAGNRVVLTFHKDHLGDYKMDEPRAA
jgi:hypothetical protein